MQDTGQHPKQKTPAQWKREKAKVLRAIIEEEKDYQRFLVEHGYEKPKERR